MIRNYNNKDFSGCIEIVNKVWDFDNRFHPKQLSELFKKIYVGSSLSASNFAIVVEENSTLQGFLFGNCGKNKLYKTEYSGLIGNLRLLTQLLLVKEVKLKKKLYYLDIIGEHEKNRRKIEPSRENEVNLLQAPDSNDILFIWDKFCL